MSVSLTNLSDLLSPSLLVFKERVEDNLQAMIRIAGSVDRLRPHCKTHKMPEVIQQELRLGIEKHKCATLAEAEMLARCGVKDVFLAYNPVGPNIRRCVELQEAFPSLSLLVTADDISPLTQLSAAAQRAGQTLGVLLDMDTGNQRTGLRVGEAAFDFYRQLADLPGIRPAGFHVYDGQNHQTNLAERTAAVQDCWQPVAAFREQVEAAGLTVPRIVAGGTGSFPIFAELDIAGLELSPGTCVFHDAGYANLFPDMEFQFAAMLLTRVVSRPSPRRVTFDLGTKACASDPPKGNRLWFPDLPGAVEVLQNEEHLVLEFPEPTNLRVGDAYLAVPRHICPTSALHQEAYVVQGDRVVGTWPVVARDRRLTI